MLERSPTTLLRGPLLPRCLAATQAWEGHHEVAQTDVAFAPMRRTVQTPMRKSSPHTPQVFSIYGASVDVAYASDAAQGKLLQRLFSAVGLGAQSTTSRHLQDRLTAYTHR